MKRRGVLGLIGGAVAAGPSMVKAAAAQGLGSLSLGTVVKDRNLLHAGVEMALGTGNPPGPDYDRLARLKNELDQFLGKSAEQLLKERLSTSVDTLDPDISVLRSFSLSAKIRMQRDRNFEADQAMERSWIEERISKFLAQNH